MFNYRHRTRNIAAFRTEPGSHRGGWYAHPAEKFSST